MIERRTAFFMSICIVILFFLPVHLFALQSSYKVGTEDILFITVWGEPDLEKTVIVSADGTINYPLLGSIPVAGLSVREIDEKITRMLETDYLVDPHVDVTIKEYHSQKVLVLGEVVHPGLYILTGPTSLLEIISKAGGVSDKVGNKVSVLRPNPDERLARNASNVPVLLEASKSFSVDLDELLKKGNLASNIELQAGDIVFLDGRKDTNILEQQVYILGQVQKAGAYDYQKGLTALNACIMAGGFEKAAAPNRTILTRNFGGKQQIFKINLDLVKEGKQQDLQLRPGDRLFVPESFW